MDPFAAIILGGLAGLVVALLLLGRLSPGSGADQLRSRPTRSVEVAGRNEVDDLDHMLEAANRRRRSRGKDELTADGLRADIAGELRPALRRDTAGRARASADAA